MHIFVSQWEATKGNGRAHIYCSLAVFSVIRMEKVVFLSFEVFVVYSVSADQFSGVACRPSVSFGAG